MIICALGIIACGMTYYGVSLSVGALQGSLYVVFVITSVAELPAYVITALTIDRAGRKRTLLVSQLLGGIFCILVSFAPAAWFEVRCRISSGALAFVAFDPAAWFQGRSHTRSGCFFVVVCSTICFCGRGSIHSVSAS